MVHERAGRRSGAGLPGSGGGGFSILELMVVGGVLALVVAIGLPTLGRSLDKSKETHSEAEILKMVETVKVYWSDTEDCIPARNAKQFKKWAEQSQYYKTLDIFDGWSKQYTLQFTCTAARRRVLWRSDGLDGRRGSWDDIVYIYDLPRWDGWSSTGAFD